jgi:hypothetical protein
MVTGQPGGGAEGEASLEPALGYLGPIVVSAAELSLYYAKRRFSITSKCQQMHEVLNIDEIKN